jgi:hypothetical protein
MMNEWDTYFGGRRNALDEYGATSSQPLCDHLDKGVEREKKQKRLLNR